MRFHGVVSGLGEVDGAASTKQIFVGIESEKGGDACEGNEGQDAEHTILENVMGWVENVCLYTCL